MALFKRVSRTIVWSIVIGVSLLSITQTVASAIGVASGLIVVSGSMEPAISTGSYIVARSVAASTVEEGDIISVRAQDGRSIIHRVVTVDEGPGDTTLFRLRGDANNALDGEVYVASSVLSPVVTVPRLGYAMAYVAAAKKALTANPAVLAGLAVGTGLLIWAMRSGRSTRTDEPGIDAPDEIATAQNPGFRFVRFPPPSASSTDYDDISPTGALR